MRVAILYNLPGQGSERSESEMAAELEVLETVEGVRKALEEPGHEPIPLRCSLESLGALRSCDAVFNLAEGFGDDLRAEPYVAGALELLGVPYTGSAPGALERCRDKYLAKLILEREGIPTPRFQLFRKADDPLHLEFPVIVKPALEDASIGITSDSLARNAEELVARVKLVLVGYRQPALVEEYIDGREINAALIIEGGCDEDTVLPLSEIVFDLPEGIPNILGFEAKWREDSPLYQRTSPLCPAPLEGQLAERIRALARQACSALGVRNYARVDFRVRGDDAFVIEVNPNPCINPNGSGFARAAEASGLGYSGLVQRILGSAIGGKDVGRAREDDLFGWGELTFRRVKAGDARLLFGWFGDASLTRYMDASGASTEEQLATSILNSKDEDFLVLVGDAAIGFASLYSRVGCTGEISYLIGDPDYRGRGIGKEIVKALIDHGFRRLGLGSIFATSSAENLSSIRALEGAGFRRIGVRRSCSVLDDRSLDDVLFDITPEDFKAVQALPSAARPLATRV